MTFAHWSPHGLLPQVEPQFRAGVRRMSVRYTIPATVIAVLMCIGTHILLDRLGLLPYPVWPAVLVGSLMSGTFAALITWIASQYMARAYYGLQAAREEFERLSNTDALTGLCNRRAFLQAFADAPQAGALVLFDIDHFKRVNDRFGHGGGDAALVATAQTLAATIAAPDVVARIGGEEFAMLIVSCAGDEAVRLAERARRAIGGQRIAFEAREFGVQVSAGIAHAAAGEGIDTLLLAADRALYLAKSQGRDRLIDAGGLAVMRAPAGQTPAASASKRERRDAMLTGN